MRVTPYLFWIIPLHWMDGPMYSVSAAVLEISFAFSSLECCMCYYTEFLHAGRYLFYSSSSSRLMFVTATEIAAKTANLK